MLTTRLGPRDPLPGPGEVMVLEASAGTGKTHTIAGQVTRYVAQGFALPRLLVVTFTRSASAELRERVRTRLVAAVDHLGGFLEGAAPSGADDVLEQLCEGARDEVARRRRRLQTALAEFDAATIATIHGFCQHVLAGIGVAADVDRTADLLEDTSGVVESVVDELFLRRFHKAVAGGPRLSRRDLLTIARRVVANPDAVIVPAEPEDPTAALRVELARAVRDKVDHRKRVLGVLSYDDLLTRLEAALRDPDHGAAAQRRLRAAYRVALIDEFQDTDPIQWEIVQRVFAHEGSGLVLIGDPKQAIYAFRGADVYAYLKAAEATEDRRTLELNWRSDAGLLRAYNILFAGANLGHADITYRHAEAAPPGQDPPRLVGAPVRAPLRLRVVHRGPGIRLVDRGSRVQVGAARSHVAADVAAQIVALLESSARIVPHDADGEGGEAPLRPGDLAVLVRTNAEAALVQRALREAGVPAVINGVGSVFATPAATDWLRLLEALERPTSPERARTCALTAFLGWSTERVATASEDEWRLAYERLHRWAGVLRDAGVASLLRTVTVDEALQRRLLTRPDGQRLLTDVQHLAELLHAAAATEQLGPTTLAGWLRDRMAEAEDDVTVEERARRLESDAAAAQVLTVHRSKGLEFPIVFCPYMWSARSFPSPVPLFHDRDDRRRVVDVGGNDSASFRDHQNDARREERGEELRLLYVALTRARHQAIVWWAPTRGSQESPLARLLFCRDGSGGHVNLRCDKASVPEDELAMTRLGELAARAAPAISVEAVPRDAAPARWAGEPAARDELAPALFDRVVDLRWRRTSYSALTALAVERPVVASEPGEPFTDDERLPRAVPATGADGPGDQARLRAVPSPLAHLPGGTEIGTAVHAVLEATDFAAADLPAELAQRVSEHQARRDVALGEGDALIDGLRRVVETPLGPLVGDLRLRDVSRRDRRDELEFELPLVGGASPTADLRIEAVAELVRAHLGPGDPLRGYADRLAEPALAATLRGYLTGSIDLVLRVDGTRFVVVDHKTNWLGTPGEALSAWHYRPDALADAMRHGHYPLQALLYSVALHRYLRWRLRGYDPGRSLAGVLYLFVRGMTGADVPRVDGRPCGVFAWRPPTRLVVDLSDLLDSGRAAV